MTKSEVSQRDSPLTVLGLVFVLFAFIAFLIDSYVGNLTFVVATALSLLFIFLLYSGLEYKKQKEK
jgi:uncharacterized RDD family membrane protein YckC